MALRKPEVNFKSLEESDYPLMLEWLLLSHVKEWWDEGEDSIEKIREAYGPEEGLERFIFGIIERESGRFRPAGFIQHYRAKGGDIGIDVFIGEPDLVNRGIGTEVVRNFARLILREQRPTRIIIDPSPENSRAIRCYEKAGFRHFETRRNSNGESRYLMELVHSQVNDVKVLRLSAGDAARAGDVVREFFKGETTIGDLNAFLGDPSNYLYVAESDGELTGFALAYKLQRLQDEGCKFFLYNIEVAGNSRRQGIGAALISRIVEAAKAEGAVTVFGITNISFEGAKDFYLSTGAMITGEREILFEYRV